MRRTSLAWACACAVVGGSRAVRADEVATGGGVSLRWQAPPGCPSAEAVRRRVVALAGPDVALSAEALVTAASGELHVVLHVTVRGSVGERVLTAASCEAAAESVAVVLALSGTPSPPPEPAPPPPIPPHAVERPAPPLLPTPAPAPARGPARRPLIRIAAEGSFDVGTLPVATEGLTVRATVTPWRGLQVGLDGTVWHNQEGFLPSSTTLGADFSLLTLDAFGCYGWHLRPSIELSPCALVEGGYLVANALHTSTNDAPTSGWAGVGLGAEARWEIARGFAVALELEGMVPTKGQSFSIQKVSGAAVSFEQVHATSVVALRGHFGPEVRF